MKLIAELEQLGYTFSIHEGKIRYAHGGARPDVSVVRPLIVALQENRDEAFSYLQARLGYSVQLANQQAPVHEAPAEPGSGEANPPNPEHGWLHLWKSNLGDLEKRRAELIAVNERGRDSLYRIGSVHGASSEPFIKANARLDRLSKILQKLERVLLIRRKGQTLGASQPKPSVIHCRNCQSTSFWIQPACGAWRCSICCPPLPGVDVFDFAPILHRSTGGEGFKCNDSHGDKQQPKSYRACGCKGANKDETFRNVFQPLPKGRRLG